MLVNNKPYIIAETAYNHEGDFSYLKKMTNDIIKMKMNGAKYHLMLDLDSYITRQHSGYEILKNWLFSEDEWLELFEMCNESGIDIIALCDDLASLKFINRVKSKIKAIELHASCLNEPFMLKEASVFDGTVILGIGGSSIEEVEFAVNFLKNEGKTDIFLMYGFQSFPTDYNKINLSKINKLKNLFNLPIGYADHTAFSDPNNVFVSCLGVANGINVLEKHYTPDQGVERIDYHAAVGKEYFLEIKEKINIAYSVYGNGDIGMSISEVNYGKVGPNKKAIVAARDIKPGEQIKIGDIAFKRTNIESPLMQKDYLKILDQKTNFEIKKDEIISWNKVNFLFREFGETDFTNLKDSKE